MSVNPRLPPSPKESPRECELRVGEPIVGFRSWRVSRRHGMVVLEGIHFRAHWPRGKPIRARCMFDAMQRAVGVIASRRNMPLPCRVTEIQSPQDVRWGVRRECTGCRTTRAHPCGVYAAMTEKEGHAYQTSAEIACVGTVALWGRIVEHEVGWRAQYAYPKELTLTRWRTQDDPDALALEISEAYGIPCHVRERDTEGD